MSLERPSREAMVVKQLGLLLTCGEWLDVSGVADPEAAECFAVGVRGTKLDHVFYLSRYEDGVVALVHTDYDGDDPGRPPAAVTKDQALLATFWSMLRERGVI